ncbi:SIMPL domain-containing protein [Thalassotalea piscium]
MSLRYCAVIVLFSFFTSAAFADNQGIEVVGKAAVKAVPDTFSITLEIKERGVVASKAKGIVDQKSQLLMRALNNIGFENKSIDSSKIVMYPVYEKPSIVIDNAVVKSRIAQNQKVELPVTGLSSNKNSVVLSYFDVTRTFVIAFDDLTQYDQLLDVVTKIGVSNISSLTMSYKNSEAIYQQALTKALQNAKMKAETIASQMNVELAGLVSLKETGYHAPQAYAMMREARASFSANVSEKQVSAQVIAVFAIQSK